MAIGSMSIWSSVFLGACVAVPLAAQDVSVEEIHKQLLVHAPENVVGQHKHCFGSRAHDVVYNMAPDAESLASCKSCVIMVRPSPEHNHLCASGNATKLKFNSGCDPLKPPSKDCPWQDITREKKLCFDVNADESCKKAEKSIGLKNSWSCSNCFVALEADIFMNITFIRSRTKLFTDLGLAEIRLSNTHLHGNLEFQALKRATKTLAGELDFAGGLFKSTFVFQAGTVPVKVDVSVPTKLTYSASLTAEASITAGVAMDIRFTDTSARWLDTDNNDNGGITAESGRFESASIVPRVNTNAKLSADFELGFHTGLEVGISNLMSYRINVDPKLPVKVACEGGGFFRSCKPCASASMDLTVSHQADVHLDGGFIFEKKTLWQWPSDGNPKVIYHKSKGLVKKCLGNAALVV